MSDIIEIPKSDKDNTNFPCWVLVTDPDGNIIKPDIICKCGEWTSIGNHHVHPDGRVTNSYYHQHGCGWHVFIKLKDWIGLEFPPKNKI